MTNNIPNNKLTDYSSLLFLDRVRKVLVTEKSTKDYNNNEYKLSLIVDRSLSKKNIYFAIKSNFDVNIFKINTLNYIKKIVTFKGKRGKRDSYKKVIITTDKKINFSDFGKI